MVQAGLVTGNAGVDFITAALFGLTHELAVCQQGPGHGNHIGLARGEDFFPFFRGVDAVGGTHRDIHFAIELGGDIGEAATGHRGDNGGDPRFVPANTGVNDGGAGLFDGLAQGHDLIPGLAAFYQVQHGQPVDNDEVRPHGFAHAPDNFHRQAHTVFVGPAPFVGSLIGPLAQKLVDEIAFRAHHFNAVVAGELCEFRGTDEIVDLPFNAF